MILTNYFKQRKYRKAERLAGIQAEKKAEKYFREMYRGHFEALARCNKKTALTITHEKAADELTVFDINRLSDILTGFDDSLTRAERLTRAGNLLFDEALPYIVFNIPSPEAKTAAVDRAMVLN